MGRHIILITNPTSGTTAKKKIHQAIRLMESQGARVEKLFTESPGHAKELALRAVSASPDLIIAAGGDGTINEIINGMAKGDIPLALLPLGTANVLARETGVPRDVVGACRVALERPSHRIALGFITFGETSRYFALMAGLGFDALSVYNLSHRLKKRSGKFAYVASGIHTLATWKASPILLRCDGRELECSNVIISNASRYGGNFVVAPKADIRASELYVTALTGMGRHDILRLATGIVTGRHDRIRGVEHFAASHVSLGGKVHIQLDGEHAGTSPAEVSIIPDALSLVY